MSSPTRRPSRGRRPGNSSGPRDRRGPRAASNQPPAEPLHPILDPPDIASFHEFTLGDEIQAVIEGMNIVKPTPIQCLAIQPVLDGKDVIAKAETGTGKTLAFGAPMMAKIDADRSSVLGLVLCPTRELAQQVESVLCELGKARGVRTALVVGGEPMHPQVDALKAGAQVVVGTPGRVLDLANQGFLNFPWTEFAVLDEADEMLEIGFLPDVQKILEMLPEERQTLLFSATFPPDLLRLARSETREPIELATAKGIATVDTIEQSYIKTNDRPMTLIRLIEQSEPDDVFLVFCERRTEVDQLFRRLERLPFGVKALHGGYDQAARFRVMSAFRDASVKALLATDVASRGLDVNHVTHVINYSVPREASDYTHRIGRTGRAGREGRAITLIDYEQRGRWKYLLDQFPWTIREQEEPQRVPRSRSASSGSSRDRDRGDRDRGRGRERGEREPVRRDREGREERPARGSREPEFRHEPGRERRSSRSERGARAASAERGSESASSRGRRERSSESRPERPTRPARSSEPRRASEPAAASADLAAHPSAGRWLAARKDDPGDGSRRSERTGRGQGARDTQDRGRGSCESRESRESRDRGDRKPAERGRESAGESGRSERPERGGRPGRGEQPQRRSENSERDRAGERRPSRSQEPRIESRVEFGDGSQDEPRDRGARGRRTEARPERKAREDREVRAERQEPAPQRRSAPKSPARPSDDSAGGPSGFGAGL